MSERSDLPARVVDQPEPGWFLCKLVRGGPLTPAQILRHEDGRWQAVIAGEHREPAHHDPVEASDVLRIWHSGRFIGEHEYRYRLDLLRWYQQHEPDNPVCDPWRPVNIHTARTIF